MSVAHLTRADVKDFVAAIERSTPADLLRHEARLLSVVRLRAANDETLQLLRATITRRYQALGLTPKVGA